MNQINYIKSCVIRLMNLQKIFGQILNWIGYCPNILPTLKYNLTNMLMYILGVRFMVVNWINCFTNHIFLNKFNLYIFDWTSIKLSQI